MSFIIYINCKVSCLRFYAFYHSFCIPYLLFIKKNELSPMSPLIYNPVLLLGLIVYSSCSTFTNNCVCTLSSFNLLVTIIMA